MIRKTKSSATLHVPDGLGGMREVFDHRFDDNWPVKASMAGKDAESWMAHCHAEAERRCWSISSLGQLASEGSSGSMTVALGAATPSRTFEIIWEKRRAGRLSVRGRGGGAEPPSEDEVRELFTSISTRLRNGSLDRAHRRGLIVYEGLPWKGELWLADNLRLGPPSRLPGALLGPQAIIVDALVDGIGTQGITARFSELMRDLRLVLSPIIGAHLQPQRSEMAWVPDVDEHHRIIDCKLRLIGYTEMALPVAFPTPGEVQPVPRETVTRPGLGRFGIWPDDQAEKVPNDIEELWRAFAKLAPGARQQFLSACNAYAIAQSHWPEQRTAYVAFLVVACEALKPAGRRHDKANVYDVVVSLLGEEAASALRELRLPPQSVRSKHVHRGVLVANELTAAILFDPFHDPSFDEMASMMSRIARLCLIEWLRCSGKYSLKWLRPPAAKPKRTVAARPQVPQSGPKRGRKLPESPN